MNLPNKEYTFSIDLTGETTNERFKGEFTSLSVLTIGQRMMVEIEKSRRTNDLRNPTGALSMYAEVIATLRVRLIDTPKWWRDGDFGMELLDENVAAAVYDKVLEGETKWRETLDLQAAEVLKKEKAKKKEPTPETPAEETK